MDVQTATPAAEPQTPQVPLEPQAPVAPAEQTPEETSVAAHAEKFGPARDKETGKFTRDEPAKDPAADKTPTQAASATAEQPTEDKRRRREKDIASHADSPRIRELTAKVRDEQRRREQLEAQLRSTTPSYTPPAAKPATNGNGATTDHWAFPKPEPKPEQFADATDPYAAWLEARQDWKLEKRDFEQQGHQQATHADVVERQMVAAFEDKFDTGASEFPDFRQVIEEAPHKSEQMPELLKAVMFTDDNPAKLMYDLARDVDFYDFALEEVAKITLRSGTGITQAAVSQLRRRLERRGLTAPGTPATASVAPTSTVTVVPKPPNAVRTGPMRSGDEPPGDGHSIADHARVWGAKPLRR